MVSKQETYAYEISKKLESYGFGSISEGTIYPIILRLQKNEMLVATIRESNNGPKRKYYSLSSKGVEALNEFKKNWQSLSEAVNKLLEGNYK
ncbi:MAG: PadR family transcriptional regulator [Clostridium sp.]|nr:PadR family transcriptional regulator [Clostridium sp.]